MRRQADPSEVSTSVSTRVRTPQVIKHVHCARSEGEFGGNVISRVAVLPNVVSAPQTPRPMTASADRRDGAGRWPSATRSSLAHRSRRRDHTRRSQIQTPRAELHCEFAPCGDSLHLSLRLDSPLCKGLRTEKHGQKSRPFTDINPFAQTKKRRYVIGFAHSLQIQLCQA